MRKRKKFRTPFEQILNEILGKEKFLNFDGDEYEDHYEGEFEEEYENMDGMRNARPRLYRSNPYQIAISNPTDKPLKAIVWGNDKFLLEKNHGSDTGIIIASGQPGVTYTQMLQKSSHNKFVTQHLRIESENSLQLSKTMLLHEEDGKGGSNVDPVHLGSQKSLYQESKEGIDVPLTTRVHGGTYWEWIIEPKTNVLISIFQGYEISTEDTLKGKEPIKTFAPANVNAVSMTKRPRILNSPKLRIK